MEVAISIGGWRNRSRGFQEVVDYVCEAERLGAAFVWSAEAWGQDAVTPLAFLAAKTSKIRLGTGILQISARAPSMTVMTVLTLNQLSQGRFVLGLGVSGPQVVEGLHGVPFAHPLSRLRETIEIVRLGLRGDKLRYSGRHFELPRPGGDGKALRIDLPPAPDLPLYLATLGPRSLELTGELADGWLGTSFLPEHADVFFEPLARGAAKTGRTLEDLDLQVATDFEIGDDVERMVAARKPRLAFVLGGMGSPRQNFYNNAYRRAGFEDAARHVQALWVDKRREEAAAAVPDEMVLKSSILGTEEAVRERLRVYREAGVNTLRLDPGGSTLEERLEMLARAIECVRDVSAP